jgi:CRISPR-associated endonuclease/helicase Cas3
LAPLIAHSANSKGERHPLLIHLRSVAELAANFAEPLGASELGRAAGLWHDLGKAAPDFQAYLLRCERDPADGGHGPDHKSAGAVLAAQRGAELLALLIQGHHGGLRDRAVAVSWLRERQADPAVRDVIDGLPAQLRELLELALPRLAITDRIQAELFGRLLFSCLVDADGLDTEAHFRPVISALWKRFDRDQAQLERRVADTPVNRVRAEIYRLCLGGAALPPGPFRLAVPTGGGKTRAALAFALRHQLQHGLGRILVAVPFTSITEQTADAYRAILGTEAVLEHHSALDEQRLEDVPAIVRLRARLAADNWDAPVVVTTTVRLFESLLSNRVSDTRRLHRLARAVIVIDEAQAIPPQVMEPALDVLQDLCRHYGASVVLSTATQPAPPEKRLQWLNEARDLVPEPERYFAQLRRVDWVTPQEAWSFQQVAHEAMAADQVLVILNRRRDALEVLDACPPGVFHLSTLLCAAHRRQVLAEVRRRLAAGERCRLVSTQVVEAGVDIDFPFVLRALAPFDSVVQAGGRCNREGRLKRGRVVVFQAGGVPQGPYRVGTDITRTLLTAGSSDFDDPGLAARYFRELYRNVDTDQYRVQEARRRLAYEEVARRFRMIEDTGSPVIVPYGRRPAQLAAQLDQVSAPNEGRQIWRALQPYLVNLRQRELARGQQRGWVSSGLVPLWTGPYDDVRGVDAVL